MPDWRGMSAEAQIIDQQVALLARKQRAKLEERLGQRLDEARLRSAAFAVCAARYALELSTEEVIARLTEGGNDFGIDVISLSACGEPELITLVQAKYHHASFDGRRNFPQSGVEKAVQAARMLLDPPARLVVNPRLAQVLDELRARRDQGWAPRIRVVLCSNGLPWKQPEAQQLIDHAGLGEVVTFEHVDHFMLVRGLLHAAPIQEELRFSGAVFRTGFRGGNVICGVMAASELARLLKKHGQPLLERNIRRYLGPLRNEVNREIVRSLLDGEGRQRFLARNLGITLCCSSFVTPPQLAEDLVISVSGLQVLNGAQTISSILHAWEHQKWSPRGADEAYVSVRLLETGAGSAGERLRREITHTNNHQTAIDLKDLHADDEVQWQLQLSIAELGYTYHRQRHDRSEDASALGPAVVAEAVLAIWRRQPQRARALVAGSYNKIYARVFEGALNGAQAVIAVLLWRSAERRSRGRRRSGPRDEELVRAGWPFAAMLMGELLLRELQISLAELDHRTFARARGLVSRRAGRYFEEAVAQLAQAVSAQRSAVLDSLELLQLFQRGAVLRYLPALTAAPRRRAAGKPAPAKTMTPARTRSPTRTRAPTRPRTRAPTETPAPSRSPRPAQRSPRAAPASRRKQA